MFPNPLYVLCPSLQDIFLDKDNGQVLADGTVTFYRDVNRTELKPIYKISGSPPNYSFVQLDNPLTLSSIGTYVDNVVNNNQITVYLYPYDEDGNVDLYYIRVNNSFGVFQFDKPAWPPSTFEEVNVNSSEVENFIPNGQFLNNFNIAFNATNPVNELNELQNGINVIAHGGFTIERSLTSISVDNFNFERISSYTPIPTGSPRYSLNFTCVSADPSDFKLIGVKFLDVNKFASDIQEYNFYFEVSTDEANFTAQIYLIYYFGSGGSSTKLVSLDSINVTNNVTKINIPVLFSTNTGDFVGDNDDDYVQLAIVLPNIPLNIKVTNFSLTQGSSILEGFPVETNADMTARGTAGWLDRPKSDGSTLYLPIIETQQGMTVDYSSIGNIITDSTVHDLSLTSNLLLCDGSQYPVDGYSDLGIPYKRLFDRIFFSESPTYLGPIFGTGKDFVTSYLLDSDFASVKIVNNSSGPTPGTSQSGSLFVIRSVCVGQNLFDSIFTYITSGSGLAIALQGFYEGVVNNINAGTSGFLAVQGNNSPILRQDASIIASNPSILSGRYFTFSAINSLGNLISYYVWFTVNGIGVDPTPGGIGIQVALLSTYNNIDLNYIIKDALMGYKIVTIQFTAASSIPSGYYIRFYANSVLYTAWYNKDGAGGEPTFDNLIEIPISNSLTAINVAQATLSAINSQFFSVPNLNGQFIRYNNNNFGLDSGSRGSINVTDLSLANLSGSFENFSVQQHKHSGNIDITGRSDSVIVPQSETIIINSTRNAPENPTKTQTRAFNTDYYGLSETNPVNTSFKAYIRY